MKQHILFICIFLFSSYSAIGQTYYYRQTQKVNNLGEKYLGDKSGQFITFTNQGCYDSDKHGNSVGNGFLNYFEIKNNIRVYRGDSYWGEAYYYVSSDYSRLNIKSKSDDMTYVYERINPTGELYTSSKIKRSQRTTLPPTSPTVVTSETSNKSQIKRTKCTYCKGSGKNPGRTYPPEFTTEVISIEYCSICQKHEKRHSHGICPSCKGKGYNEHSH